jgi:hypothetical protein
LQGSPRAEIGDDPQIILAICAAGEFFVKFIFKGDEDGLESSESWQH